MYLDCENNKRKMAKCWCDKNKLIDFSKNYYKCANCGTLVSKKLDEISKALNSNIKDNNYIYNSDYWKKKMVKQSGLGSFDNLLNSYFTGRIPYWVSTIAKYKKAPAKVFEIGCGLGQLSYVLKQFGYDVTASEMDKEIVNFIKKEFGVKTKLGEYNEQIKYDLIIANDVLEHIVDPVNFISKIKHTLKKDGYFVVQTPCYDGVSSFEELKKNNERFLSLMIADEHLYIFNKKSLTKLLNKFDLKCVFEDAYFGNDYDMYAIIGNEKPVKTIKNNNYLINALASLEKEKRELEKNNYEINVRLAKFDSDIKYLNSVAKNKNEIELERNELTSKIKTFEEELKSLDKEKKEAINEASSLKNRILDLENTKQKYIDDIHSFEEKINKLNSELMITLNEKQNIDHKFNALNKELLLVKDNADRKIDINKLDEEDLVKLRNIYSFMCKNSVKECNNIDNKTLNDIISFIDKRIK